MTDRRQYRVHPLPALGHRLFGQADDEEFGQAWGDLHLDLDGAPRSSERHRGDMRDHHAPCPC